MSSLLCMECVLTSLRVLCNSDHSSYHTLPFTFSTLQEIAVVYPGGGPPGEDRTPFVNIDSTTIEGIERAPIDCNTDKTAIERARETIITGIDCFLSVVWRFRPKKFITELSHFRREKKIPSC